MTQQHRKISEIIADIYGHVKTYLTNYFQYLGYDSAEKFVKITSYILTNFIIAALTGLFLNIIIISLIFYVGYINNSIAGSLLFIVIFYFILGLIFILFKKPLIKNPIQKQIIQFIFAENETEDHETKK